MAEKNKTAEVTEPMQGHGAVVQIQAHKPGNTARRPRMKNCLCSLLSFMTKRPIWLMIVDEMAHRLFFELKKNYSIAATETA